MLDAQRLKDRMRERGLSQAELARRVGITQASINKLTSGSAYGSRYLHEIARALVTTAAYLTGEIDDPDEGAAPPPARPTVQVATMQVLLPDPRALSRMFLGVLKASEGLSQEALADELAQMLPKGLGLLQGPLVFEASDADDDPQAAPGDDRADRPARQRA